MSSLTEHKTVQSRILAYAQEMLLRHGYEAQVGWTLVPWSESKGAGIAGNRDFHFPTLCYSHP